MHNEECRSAGLVALCLVILVNYCNMVIEMQSLSVEFVFSIRYVMIMLGREGVYDVLLHSSCLRQCGSFLIRWTALFMIRTSVASAL